MLVNDVYSSRISRCQQIHDLPRLPMFVHCTPNYCGLCRNVCHFFSQQNHKTLCCCCCCCCFLDALLLLMTHIHRWTYQQIARQIDRQIHGEITDTQIDTIISCHIYIYIYANCIPYQHIQRQVFLSVPSLNRPRMITTLTADIHLKNLLYRDIYIYMIVGII